MKLAAHSHQRGSIYVLTLLTVAAIGSMILIGVSLRGTRNTKASIIAQMNANSTGVFDAAELAIAKIATDPDWKTSAQKGSVYADFTLGERVYSSTVVDADTLTTPTDTSVNYRVTVSSTSGLAQETARVDFNNDKIDYYAYLQSIGLDAYWALDEVSKSAVADEPEDGRDGTYLDPSIAGAAMNDEDGIVPLFADASDHVETPYDSQYADDTQGTVSLWMKLTGASNVRHYGIFGQRFTHGGIPAISLTCIAGSLVAYMDDGGGYSIAHLAQTGPSIIKVGQWHHVALSWGPAGLTIYVDGVEQASTPGCTVYWDTVNGSGGIQPLLIGSSYIAAFASRPQIGFEGSIARVAILSNQLSAGQVAALAAIKPDQTQLKLIENTWVRVYE